MSNIILAICLGILSYSMLNIGMGLQKKGAATLPKIEEESFGRNMKNFFTNKIWLIGFILVQSQWVLLTLALELGSLSIVTPLMSVGMVALVIFSYFYLKEPISKVEGIGIVAIIVGIVLSGITNIEKREQETLEIVLDCFTNTFGIIYLAAIFVFSVVLVLLSILRKFANADILFGVAAGITDGLGAIFLKAYMGGADFNDASVIQAAALRWEWWVLFVLMIIFNATATIYLQVAYQRGKAVIVAPIFAVMAMLTPVFGGIIIYNEWGSLPQLLLAGKIVSMVIVTVGIIVLSIYSARYNFEKELTKSNEQQNHKIEEKQEAMDHPDETKTAGTGMNN